MKLVSPVIAVRPSDNIVAMLHDLATEIEQDPDAFQNVFVVIEHSDSDETDVRGFGPCDDPYRAAGILLAAARDVAP